jgi:hypothetical protein
MFQQIHGVKEQQDFSNGLNTMADKDAAPRLIPFSRMRGDLLLPSRVCMGGNVRKSSVTISCSIAPLLPLPVIKFPAGDLFRSSTFIDFHEQLIRVYTDYHEVHHGKEE